MKDRSDDLMTRVFMSQLRLVIPVSVFYLMMNVFVDYAGAEFKHGGAWQPAAAAAILPFIFVFLDLWLKTRLLHVISDEPGRERAISAAARIYPRAIVCHVVLISVFYWGPQYLMAFAVKLFMRELNIFDIMGIPWFAAIHMIPLTAHTALASYVFVLLVSGAAADEKHRGTAYQIITSSLRLAFSRAAVPIFLLSAPLNCAKFLFYTVLDHSIFGDSASSLVWVNTMLLISYIYSTFIYLVALNLVVRKRAVGLWR